MQVLKLKYTRYGYKVNLSGEQDGEYYRKEDVDAEFERLKERVYDLNARLQEGRDYLMRTRPADVTVEDALEALGFGRNGYENI